MKLLYIANARIPGDKAHSAQIMAMCEAFALSGAEVTLVVPRRTHDQVIADPFVYHAAKSCFTIVWVPSIDLVRYGFFGFLIQSITFARSVVIYCKKNSVDAFYTRDTVSLFILSLYKNFRSKLFFEAHKRIRNPIIARRINRAAGLIVINESIKKFFIGRGVSETRILVAHDGVNLALFDQEISMSDARAHLNFSQDAFIVCYTGRFQTMGADKGITDVFQAIHLLGVVKQNVLFICVGAMADETDRYMDKARTYGIEDQVKIISRVAVDQLVWYQKAANVLVMPFPNTDYYAHDISPLKLFEYITSKRPVVASDLSSVTEILNTANAVLYPAGSIIGLRDALQWVMLNPDTAQARALCAYQISKKFSWTERAKHILGFVKYKQSL